MILILLRGLLGLTALLSIAFLLSRNRKAINWRQVAAALAVQIVLGVSILYIPWVGGLMEWLGSFFVQILAFTQAGTRFLLGDLVDMSKMGHIFLFQALPVIIFFAAITALLYYYGVIQWLVKGFARMLRRLLKISGAEGLVVTGNLFLGMCEAPILSKKYLPAMTSSQLFLVLVSGMATIAGGVMATYIVILGGDDPAARVLFAKHFISASVMAAPAAVIMAKMIFPETEPLTDDTVEVTRKSVGSNPLDALSNGASEGVRLVVNIAAMLLVFIALVALFNFLLGDVIGHYTGLNNWVEQVSGGRFAQFSLEFLLSLIFMPIAWLIGVSGADVGLVGALLGKKIVLNEFVAYIDLAAFKAQGLFAYDRSVMMATYLLCGFANFASIGMLIGGVGGLIPERKAFIARYGLLAMVAATLASALSATLVGVMM